jgi:predicted nucleic-acid-binding protein
MIGIDTNVLIRYIVQDEPEQSKIAAGFIENQCTSPSPGYISQIVLCEIVWVLKRAYKYDKEIIVDVINQILLTKEFKVENSQNAWLALKEFKTGKADFADHLLGISNNKAGCNYTITLDKTASLSSNFKLLT